MPALVRAFELFRNHLSQDTEYDWGLRNLLQVIRVAGQLLRINTEQDEAAIVRTAIDQAVLSKVG